jgi:hypothetical protein
MITKIIVKLKGGTQEEDEKGFFPAMVFVRFSNQEMEARLDAHNNVIVSMGSDPVAIIKNDLWRIIQFESEDSPSD